MTNYVNKHVFGTGPSSKSIKRQAQRARRMSEWASKNPEKLITPAELIALLKGQR